MANLDDADTFCHCKESDLNVGLFTYTYSNTYSIFKYIYIYICIHLHLHLFFSYISLSSTYIYIYMYIYIYIFIYVYVHKNIYIPDSSHGMLCHIFCAPLRWTQVDWLLARVVIYCGSRSIIVSMGWVTIVPVRELLCGVIECALHLFGPAARLES